MPKIRALHHVALTVPTERLDDARRFYSDVLGLTETLRPEADLGRPGVWYRIGNVELHIQCRDAAPLEQSDRHPALLVDDVAEMKRHLQANGVEIIEAPALLGRERFFCRDPFGNRIEFVGPRA